MKLKPVIFLLSLLLLSACDRKPEAIGDEIEVSIVAEQKLFEKLEPALNSALARTIYTPQPEPAFKLTYLSPDELNKAAIRPNIIMAGLLGSSDRTSGQVRAMLTPQIIQQVEKGESFLFRKEDPWAENQLLLVMAANDSAGLRQQIAENGDYIYSVLKDNVFKRMHEQLYSSYEKDELGEQLFDSYRWRVRVPHDFFLYRDEPDFNFIMLRRTSPERWLFVRWIDAESSADITEEWVIEQRTYIGKKFYEGDSVVDKYLTSAEVEFAGRRALMLQGLWENNKKIAGGPFRSFTFYDEDTKRIYTVDMAVFAPGMEKEPYIRQLEVMARTFRTEADLIREEPTS